MRNLWLISFSALAAASLAGCAGQVITGPQAEFETKAIEAPAVGTLVSAAVGDVVATRERITARRGAFIRNVSTGQEIALVETYQDGEVWYCDFPNLFCYRDTDNDDHLDRLKSGRNTAPMNVIINHQPFRIPYRKSDAVVSTPDSFRMQLLNQGVDGRTLRLSYREFTNNFARPAFQQDLTYNIVPSGPTAVSFRGLQLTILSADNSGMQYRVDRQFLQDPAR
jgi:hypothetical protein